MHPSTGLSQRFPNHWTWGSSFTPGSVWKPTPVCERLVEGWLRVWGNLLTTACCDRLSFCRFRIAYRTHWMLLHIKWFLYTQSLAPLYNVFIQLHCEYQYRLPPYPATQRHYKGCKTLPCNSWKGFTMLRTSQLFNWCCPFPVGDCWNFSLMFDMTYDPLKFPRESVYPTPTHQKVT